METENIISGTFYEICVRGLFAQPNGTQKMEQEVISVLASSFSEAESIAFEQFGNDVQVKRISIAPYTEVALMREGEVETFFYRVRIAYEDSEKRRKHSFCYLVQSTSTRQAERDVESKITPLILNGYVTKGVVQTKLTAVILK